MTAPLALLAAASAGTADFLGGLGSRRVASLVVTTASQLVGFGMALVVAAVVGGEVLASDLGWGAIGGLGAAGGLLSIYTGYAVARVSVAAPVAGVGAAALPVVVDSLIGSDDLSARSTAGVILGLVAIALVSISRSESGGGIGVSLLYGLGGAIGLGVLLLCLSRASEDGGLWPVVATRASGFGALAVVSIATGVRLSMPRVVVPHVMGIAALITATNGLFLAATRVGSTSVAAVLTSLFPAVTVFWAWTVFRERLRSVQLVGLGVALVAVSLIVAG